MPRGGFALTTLVGVLLGAAGGGFLFLALDRGWVPENLRNTVTLAVVLATFAVSDLIRAESGLLAVTVMGAALANQRRFSVEGIIDFKEELRSLFLAILFIVLSARLSLEELGAAAPPPAPDRLRRAQLTPSQSWATAAAQDRQVEPKGSPV